MQGVQIGWIADWFRDKQANMHTNWTIRRSRRGS